MLSWLLGNYMPNFSLVSLSKTSLVPSHDYVKPKMAVLKILGLAGPKLGMHTQLDSRSNRAGSHLATPLPLGVYS